MAGTVLFDVDGGVATLRLSRAHGNAINADLVADLAAAFRRAAAAGDVRGVLFGATGKLFCPGLDLVELIELDRPAMERFLREFSACLLELYAFPKPVVAAVGGHAVAGGCVLALTADWRVLKRGAVIGLAEVKVGVPFPFGVVTLLERSIAPARLAEVALFGRNYEGEEAVAVGLAHEAHAAEGFEDTCRARLADLIDREPNAFAITKRYLRAEAIERMRERDPPHAHEFLDAWFSAPTRERVMRVVQELGKR